MHQHDVRAGGDQADGREIPARVIADVGIERRIDRKRACGDQKRVAVGFGSRDLTRRDGAARAAAVLDHDGLADARRHFLGNDARDHVVAAARRIGHHQGDRANRIFGRGGTGGAKYGTKRERRSENSRPQRRSHSASLTPPWRRIS